ncbi:LacI family DNA-binding transcriptional regulator [Pengzhenrongella frigida]|uniref:LacI family DNA-binding transcriptional regulator n=1 Tax=Pengzhenrongella frigida TaxID=1259133 RepID=A0A4Q5MYR6_9MICO|nr:LacI family DNA-binding transcriptional regulator [Cellulomonas sp. HLT2-17]RYV50073.1 LacI family DNA-binding transcriptional regulator [Cellulomonas sp. HLT2-17]
MSDVARVAGVSHQTVSRVLNAHTSVRPETRARVLEAIAELGYRRNIAARALVTRRSGTIGVVTVGLPYFGPSSTLIAVEEAARAAGYFVSIATLAGTDASSVDKAVEYFLGQAVEGIIVIAPQDDVRDALVPFASQIPLVMIASEPSPGFSLHTMSVDQELGARLATRHLLDLGHREVVHVAGPLDWIDARARVAGWRAELAVAGVAPGAQIAADWSAERGYAVGRSLVREGAPTAVFAANDQLALGLLHAFAEGGVAVPQDVSVVGFDDIGGAAHFHPPLTTVRQEFADLGRRCLELLVAAMEGLPLDPTPIPPRLVVRASTGPGRA